MTKRSVNNMKPFLRWAGSKKKLLPILKYYWGNGFSRYLEPFAGSASLYFSLNPGVSVLSDINYELVNTYLEIKTNPLDVYKIFSEYEISDKFYYEVRSLNLNLLTLSERAARFIYLNRFCFNGLYRTNKNGNFNVPYGKSKTGRLPNLIELQEYSNKLKSAKVVCGDFYKILSIEVKEGDFIYLDPPYAVKNKKIFSQYGPDTFGIDDLIRLRAIIDIIVDRKAYFLLSYADCDEIKELFKDFSQSEVTTQRNISGFAKHRRLDTELLISNVF